MTLEEQYRLSCYKELTTLDDHDHIYLVKHKLSGEIFVKKIHNFLVLRNMLLRNSMVLDSPMPVLISMLWESF